MKNAIIFLFSILLFACCKKNFEGSEIKGRITEVGSGKPVARAKIIIEGIGHSDGFLSPGSGNGFIVDSVFTDNDGNYIFSSLLWQAWEQAYAPRARVAGVDTPARVEAADPAAPTPSQADVPAAPAAVAVDGTSVPAPAAIEARGTTVTVTTDLVRAVIDTRGGTLLEVDLLRYPREVKLPEPVRLINDAPERFFVAQSGLVDATGAAPDHRAIYVAASNAYQLADGSDTLEVPLTWTDGRGIAVTKTYRFTRGSYVVEMSDVVANSAATPWSGSAYRQLQRVPPPAHTGGASFTNPEAYSFVGAAWYSPEERFEKLKFDDFAENALQRDVTGGL